MEVRAWDYAGPLGADGEGKIVKIRGTVSEYRGTTQIVLDRIRGQDDIPHIDLISKRTCNSSIYDPAHMIPVH